MASSHPDSRVLICPACGERFRVPPEMAGRRGKCGKCGTVFTIPGPAEADDWTPVAPGLFDEDKDDTPAYVGVDCRVCQTRLYGGLDQVGKPLKCPDCGAMTVLPPPKKRSPDRGLAALEGEQYELWDTEEQPLPAALLAAQPNYIAVVCRLCDTRMYATEDQVGQELVCPDCRTRTVVPPPPRRPAKQSTPAPAGHAFAVKLDQSEPPSPALPALSPDELHRIDEEVEAASLGEFASAKSRSGGRRRTDPRGRPIMPRWPLLTGVLSFPFQAGTRVRWLALSVSLLIVTALLTEAVAALGRFQGGNWQRGMETAAGLGEMLASMVLALVLLATASSIFLVIVSESSEGNHRIHGWPAVNFIESLVDMGYLVAAMSTSAVPGLIIGQFAAHTAAERAVMVGASLVLLLPIVLLSQLAAGSPWALLDGRVLRSVVSRVFSWLTFYVLSALLAAACVLVVIRAAQIHRIVPALCAPVYVGALLLYFRLLGRLGWRISDAGDWPTRD